MEWSNERLRPYSHVFLLSSGSSGSKDAALFVVEEVFDSTPISPGLLNQNVNIKVHSLKFSRDSYSYIFTIVVLLISFLVLYCDCSYAHRCHRSSEMWVSMAKLSWNIYLYRGSISYPVS